MGFLDGGKLIGEISLLRLQLCDLFIGRFDLSIESFDLQRLLIVRSFGRLDAQLQLIMTLFQKKHLAVDLMDLLGNIGSFLSRGLDLFFERSGTLSQFSVLGADLQDQVFLILDGFLKRGSLIRAGIEEYFVSVDHMQDDGDIVLFPLVIEFVISLGFFRLLRKRSDLISQFFKNIVNTDEVLLGCVQFSLGLFFSRLKLHDTGGFLENFTSVFGLGGKDIVNSALTDDGITVLT